MGRFLTRLKAGLHNRTSQAKQLVSARRTFPIGKTVVVLRSSGDVETGWTVVGFTTVDDATWVIVQKSGPDGRLEKTVPLDDLAYINRPETQLIEFGGVHNFAELFQLLDGKKILWGSQKRYTAGELKVLINRVRTQKTRWQLPLQAIPVTGGLRQRVKELCKQERR